MAEVIRKHSSLQLLAGVMMLVASMGLGARGSSAEQLASRSDHQQQDALSKSGTKHADSMAAVTPSAPPAKSDVKPVRTARAKGPYYVDFRARTAATYGHAFIWYGKTSENEVEVAVWLRPATSYRTSWDTSYLSPPKQGRAMVILMSNI